MLRVLAYILLLSFSASCYSEGVIHLKRLTKQQYLEAGIAVAPDQNEGDLSISVEVPISFNNLVLTNASAFFENEKQKTIIEMNEIKTGSKTSNTYQFSISNAAAEKTKLHLFYQGGGISNFHFNIQESYELDLVKWLET